MELSRALARFESVMSTRWPEQFAALRPGLDDAGIARLSAAVHPYLLTAQIEELYRWRDGGDSGVFGGWWMRSADDVIGWREFMVRELLAPPIWLPIFDNRIINAVTLGLPDGEGADDAVWYAHNEEDTIARLFDSVASLLDVIADAAEAGALALCADGVLALGGRDLLENDAWTPWRLARCPGAYQRTDPPPGTVMHRFAAPDWPWPWLASLGVTEESLRPRGATHTIAELIEASVHGPVAATIRGRVITGAGIALDTWIPRVSDGTADISVMCDMRAIPIGVNIGQEGEFDVVLQPPPDPDPARNDDPEVAARVRLLGPLPPPAQALAARRL